MLTNPSNLRLGFVSSSSLLALRDVRGLALGGGAQRVGQRAQQHGRGEALPHVRRLILKHSYN